MQRTLHTRFKHSGRALAATSVSGPVNSRLFYITDQDTGTRFLVDTGAEVSIIPPPPRIANAHRINSLSWL